MGWQASAHTLSISSGTVKRLEHRLLLDSRLCVPYGDSDGLSPLLLSFFNLRRAFHLSEPVPSSGKWGLSLSGLEGRPPTASIQHLLASVLHVLFVTKPFPVTRTVVPFGANGLGLPALLNH